MKGESTGLPAEELGLLLRWVQQQVQLRWLAAGAVLVGTLVAYFVLDISLPLFPVLCVTALIAFYNALFYFWQQAYSRREKQAMATAHWARRFALAQVIADLIALTVLLHFVGGIESPFFLFYLFHVGFGSIVLKRRDAYWVTALAIGLFVLLVGAQYLGWLPHVHLEGLVPAELYQEPVYVAAVLIGFALTLIVTTAGATTIVAELHRQWEQRALAREEELERIGDKLAELDRMRTFFLGLASHDLKTPLAVVANYLQAILDGFVGEVNEKQLHWMTRANTRVLELIRMINDFLDVSQLAPERILDEMEDTTLSAAVEQSIEEVQARADEKNISLRVELPQGLPPVHAAPRRLQQVITNLLDNAVKFSPRQGEVVLSVCQHGDGIRVDVVDTGPGVPALYMPHVFEDYFRARRKEFVPGAGIGLSTARKIVETHGGEIWVESPYLEDGTGSCFSFTLPCGWSKECE
jgi:signal transduction histidine kinase